jgi:predicted nucleic acid-binding protein
VALEDTRRILESPTLTLLQETPNHAEVMMRVLRESDVSGNLVHDAHIAALCIEHGVRELVTGDRDFARFKSLNIRNPFL